MTSIVPDVVSWLAYPMQVAWNYDRSDRKNRLEQELGKAKDSLDAYGAKALDVYIQACGLHRQFSAEHNALPWDHQSAYCDPSKEAEAISGVYQTVDKAYNELSYRVNTRGPELLTELKGKWLAIGKDFELLEACLREIKIDQEKIDAAAQDLLAKQRLISRLVTDIKTRSEHDVSFTRGGRKALEYMATAHMVYQLLSGIGSWFLGGSGTGKVVKSSSAIGSLEVHSGQTWNLRPAIVDPWPFQPPIRRPPPQEPPKDPPPSQSLGRGASNSLTPSTQLTEALPIASVDVGRKVFAWEKV